MTQNTTQPTQTRIVRLERRLYFAYLIIAAVVLLQIGSFVWSPAQASNEAAESAANKIIKTRGIIIVDEQGRERILLGAPIPAAKNRVRTDLARVREVWGKRFPNPDKYMEIYKNLNHNVTGMLVLDQNGFDSLAVGEQMPDPNVGKRIGETDNGLIFNNEEGFERGGFGWTKFKDGSNNVVLGLDSSKGESLTLVVDEKDRIVRNVGIGIRDSKNQSMFLGSASPNNFRTKLPDAFNGLLIKDGDEVKHQINTLQKK